MHDALGAYVLTWAKYSRPALLLGQQETMICFLLVNKAGTLDGTSPCD